MKYLNPKLSRVDWDKACKSYYKAYKKIEKHFPHEFSETFLNGDFHDSTIIEMKLVFKADKKSDLDLILHEDTWKDAKYYLKFKNIANIKMDFFYVCTWDYAEILPGKMIKHDKARRFSLEVIASENQFLYVEFESLEYSQEIK